MFEAQKSALCWLGLVLLVNPLDDFGQFPVFLRDDIAGIVGGEVYFDGVPHIAPVGVVVQFFSMESHFGHKSKGLCEIAEAEGRLQAVFIFVPHEYVRLIAAQK